MRVYLAPTGLHSRAMVRVTKALTRYAPNGIEITNDIGDCDIRILHMIGQDVETWPDKYVIIQYCLKSAGEHLQYWCNPWKRASLVWSYYDIQSAVEWDTSDVNFYRSPLGVDDIFTKTNWRSAVRDIGVLSSGFVSGPCAEAIEEVALAAARTKLRVMHLGPDKIEGMLLKPSKWWNVFEISDTELAQLYTRVQWVSGLRHVEGFELPALEGMTCGCRPIVFDREDMTPWYGDHAVLVPECSGEELVDRLAAIFETEPPPFTELEHSHIVDRFSWKRIADGFWQKLLERESL